MTVTQSIPNTRLTGSQTFNFTNTAQPWSTATVTLDRTISGGLNAAATSTTLDISIDYSPDGGTTWLNIAGRTLQGGVLTAKGQTQTTETLSVGIGVDFPTGTAFRVNITVNGGTAVRIAGTVVYS